MTLADTYTAVQNWFQLTRVELPLGWKKMIDDYRTLKGSGNSRNDIFQYFAKHPNPILPADRTQIAALINAMDRAEAGIPIQDPNERPSWAEAWDMGPGAALDTAGAAAGKLPWGLILGVAAAYAFVTVGLPNMLRK